MKAILKLLLMTLLAAAPIIGQEPEKKFPRGAKRSDPVEVAKGIVAGRIGVHAPKLAAEAAPPTMDMRPSRLSFWGNNQYGICVSAESAFAIGAYSKFAKAETYITEPEIIAWARARGVLNGADLLNVIQMMQRDGVKDEKGVVRKEGKPSVVNWKDEAALKDAISQGPISIAIAADALPSGAGNKSGWYSLSANNRNTDHCVSLCGYGPMKYLFPLFGLTVPSGVDPERMGYLLFTWNTVGIVTIEWLRGTCEEAWLRTPTVLDLPAPGPTPDPGPTPGTFAIVPAAASVLPKGSVQFSAAGAKFWAVVEGGGSVTQTGLYTAPDALGTATIMAVGGSPLGIAQAKVTITNTPPPPQGPVITIGADVKKGAYELVPAGTLAELERIKGTLNRLFPPAPEPTPLPKIEVPETTPAPQSDPEVVLPTPESNIIEPNPEPKLIQKKKYSPYPK